MAQLMRQYGSNFIIIFSKLSYFVFRKVHDNPSSISHTLQLQIVFHDSESSEIISLCEALLTLARTDNG